MKPGRVVTFSIVCRWHRATAPPAAALKWILKRLGRVFQAQCVTCRIIEPPNRTETTTND